MIRIFTDNALAPSHLLQLSHSQCHYLLNVMRLREGAPVAVFNGKDGEWLTHLQKPTKKTVALQVQHQLKTQESCVEKHLIFPPLRQNRLDFMIEKATEMGVTHFQPILTEHTSVKRINTQRLRKITVEAAEQAERLTLPIFNDLIPLQELLGKWPPRLSLYYGAERMPHGPAAMEISPPCGILIGPEGGFSQREKRMLTQFSLARAVWLGPLILRAETAALALLGKTLYSALNLLSD